MFAVGPLPHGTVKDYKPVTADMLLNPSPDDWLQFSRTYDAWRYSPLKQVNKKNVGQLHIAWPPAPLKRFRWFTTALFIRSRPERT